MKKRSNKQRHASRGNMHGDISKRKGGKPMDPQDHSAYDMKGLPTDHYDGKKLGMEAQPATMPQTMQGPAQYPGQELGA